MFVGPLAIALPILFTFGAAYSLWLAYLVYGLRDRRKQFRFEFLYFAVMSLLGVIVLALGFALPYVDDDVFYRVYNIAVGLGIAIMIVALVANPQLIGDLSEAARVKYGTSTLGGVDIRASLDKLARADDRWQGIPERGPESEFARGGSRTHRASAFRVDQFPPRHGIFALRARAAGGGRKGAARSPHRRNRFSP